jgi:hypothetical protein
MLKIERDPDDRELADRRKISSTLRYETFNRQKSRRVECRPKREYREQQCNEF